MLPYLGVVLGLTLAFFATRLINLTLIPIFTDEAIYLRWGQIALGDPRWRFISLVDGKQPLLIWLFLPALKVIADPLVAGRFVSVLAGFFGMLGMAIFSWYMVRTLKAFTIGGLMYLVIPIFLVYDRLALYDTLVTTIGIWALFLSYLFGKTLRLDVALLLGTAIGAGLLTKSSATYFLILLPATLLLVRWQEKNRGEQLLKWIGLSLVVFLQSQVYNNIIRLSEFRHMVGEKNLQFLYSAHELLGDPFRHFWGNLNGLTSWLQAYLSWPLIIAIIVAFVWFAKKNRQSAGYFALWFAVPFFSLALFGKIIYPRFLLFMVPPLLVPLGIWFGDLLTRKINRLQVYAILGIVLLPPVYFGTKVLTDPVHAPFPPADHQQFISDWPAGYGIKEVVAYLTDTAKRGPLVVGTDGTFGLFPMSLELYLGTNKNVVIKPYWPLDNFPEELRVYAKTQPTFLIFKEKQEVPAGWPLELVAQYRRGEGSTYLKFFRVKP